MDPSALLALMAMWMMACTFAMVYPQEVHTTRRRISFLMGMLAMTVRIIRLGMMAVPETLELVAFETGAPGNLLDRGLVINLLSHSLEMAVFYTILAELGVWYLTITAWVLIEADRHVIVAAYMARGRL